MKPQQSQNFINGFMKILQVTVVVAERGGVGTPGQLRPWLDFRESGGQEQEATHRDKNKDKQ